MGNILRKLCGSSGNEDTIAGLAYQAAPLGPHGVTVDTVGYAALASDLFQFEITNQVPDGLDSYVQSSKAAQIKWYSKLHAAWKSADPPPNNAEEASQLVLQTLKGHRKADVEGLLSFYGLGGSTASTVAVPAPSIVVPAPAAVFPQVAVAVGPWPKGVQYELHTLPVESNGAVDGDTLTVYVNATDDAREAAAVPLPVQDAVARWRTARLHNDYKTADALQKEVQKSGYRILDSKTENGSIIARRYKVRLRGIDAPESSMPFGPEAKVMLQSLVEGQPLHLLVYTVDRYGRIVADVHCNKGFVQEILLKNGSCWHYIAYDKRPELSKWEQEARQKRLGLWSKSNPVQPWEYRKDKK